jgi:hypothetical protein
MNYTVVAFTTPSARRFEMLVEAESLGEATKLAAKMATSGYVDITITMAAGKTYSLKQLRRGI